MKKTKLKLLLDWSNPGRMSQVMGDPINGNGAKGFHISECHLKIIWKVRKSHIGCKITKKKKYKKLCIFFEKSKN